MDGSPQTGARAAQAPKDAPSSEPDPGTSWIHDLAGEWQAQWSRLQCPQERSGASLLK